MKIHAYRFGFVLLLVGLQAYPAFAAEYTGLVEWARRTNLSMPVSGVVARVNVNEGMRVKKGEVMLSLDQRYFDAQLASAKATVARHKPGRDEAKKELQRSEELFERTVLSQVELDKARIDYEEKQAIYRGASASYQRAQLDKEYSELKAPYDLVVIRALVVQGQTVVNELQATPMVEVADAGNRLISLDAKTSDARSLQLGSMITVSSQNKNIKARVVALDAGQERKSIHVLVLVGTKAIPGLRVGSTVKVQW